MGWAFSSTTCSGGTLPGTLLFEMHGVAACHDIMVLLHSSCG